MDEELRDNIRTTKDLVVTMKFADEDTRTVIIKNPKNNITITEILTVFNNLVGPIVYSDKSGAAYTGIENPLVRETTILELTQ